MPIKRRIHPDGRHPKFIDFCCGVYEIVHYPTKRKYVGSSKEIQKRLYLHLVQLRKNTHHCPYLQNVWNKYGEDAFDFFLIEECPKNQLDVREQFHMDATPELGFELMNCHPAAGSSRDFKHSEATRKKMSISAKKASNTPEQKKMRSERAKRQHAEGSLGRGKPWSKETRQKHKDTIIRRREAIL